MIPYRWQVLATDRGALIHGSRSRFFCGEGRAASPFGEASHDCCYVYTYVHGASSSAEAVLCIYSCVSWLAVHPYIRTYIHTYVCTYVARKIHTEIFVCTLADLKSVVDISAPCLMLT